MPSSNPLPSLIPLSPSVHYFRYVLWTPLTLAGFLLLGCGGGGSGTASVPPVVRATLSGSVVKGPVAGAAVCVYELTAAGKGRQLGCTVTRDDGSYVLDLAYLGEVIVEAVGGTYTDEATGLAGVGLSEPLSSAGSLGATGTNLIATPLTAMALRRALAGGGPFTLADFTAKAGEVRDALGLPGDVDLAHTLPDVTPGKDNPYGAALKGLSSMMGKGATLAGIIASVNTDKLKSGIRQAELCKGQEVPPYDSVWGVASPYDIRLNLAGVPGAGVVFTVTNPLNAWRSLLPSSGPAMGCSMINKTSSQVKLNCPNSALANGLNVYAVNADVNNNVPVYLPASQVLLMGARVLGEGVLPGGVPLNFYSGGPSNPSLGGLVAVGAISNLWCSGGATLSASGLPTTATIQGGGTAIVKGVLVTTTGSHVSITSAGNAIDWSTYSVESRIPDMPPIDFIINLPPSVAVIDPQP